MERPVYIIFAGVNGAGKSTFYHTDFWKTESLPKSMSRINSDEIAAGSGWSSDSESDQIRAGKEALHKLNHCLEARQSFNQETTLTGHIILRTIRRAKKAGYKIIVYYIGVDSADIALSRIEHRVSVGGHDIDEEAVRRRWRASLSNLSNTLDLCDEAVVIDNSVEFVPVARWTSGVISWVGDLRKHGSWLLEAVYDDSVWRH